MLAVTLANRSAQASADGLPRPRASVARHAHGGTVTRVNRAGKLSEEPPAEFGPRRGDCVMKDEDEASGGLDGSPLGPAAPSSFAGDQSILLREPSSEPLRGVAACGEPEASSSLLEARGENMQECQARRHCR